MSTPDEDTAEYPPDALQHAAPQPARYVEGRRVVIPDQGELPPPDDDLWRNLWQARILFDEATQPFQDAEYRHVRPGLERLSHRLTAHFHRLLRDEGRDDLIEEFEQILEILNMLPHRRQP